MYSVQGLHVYCSLFSFSLFPCSTPPTHTFWLSSFHLQCIIFSYCSCDSLMVTLLHLLIPAVRLCWSLALPFPFLVFSCFHPPLQYLFPHQLPSFISRPFLIVCVHLPYFDYYDRTELQNDVPQPTYTQCFREATNLTLVRQRISL